MKIPVVDKLIGCVEQIATYVNKKQERRRKAVIRTSDEIVELLDEIFEGKPFDENKKDLAHYLEQYHIRRKRVQ